MNSKILLVEDEEFMRELTSHNLVQSGYTVDTACDGNQAWERLAANPSGYDLILLDRNMPGLNGIDLLSKIKSDQRLANLPVVMLSTSDNPEEIAESLRIGAYYYLTKPASLEVLQSVIKNTLREVGNRSELLNLISQQRNGLLLVQRAEFCFRTLQEAKDLALLLADLSLEPHRTVNGYSELLVNAVEHGNLGISYTDKSQLLMAGRWDAEIESRLQSKQYLHRRVSVLMERTSTAFLVTITDQGDGFQWRNFLTFSPERAFDLNGRGIAMSKAMCFDSLEYNDKGNSVVTTVFNTASKKV